MRGAREKFSEADIRRAIVLHDRGHSWRYAALDLGISESRLMVRVGLLIGKPYPSSVQANKYRLVSAYEYDRMMGQQKGICAICGAIPPPKLVVDHQAATGKVRGLLCFSCNTALGWIEKKAWLTSALAYLRSRNRRVRKSRQAGQKPQGQTDHSYAIEEAHR